PSRRAAHPASTARVRQRNSPNDTGRLEWARRTNEQDTIREGAPVELLCCPRNYDEIQWFRVNETTQELVRLPDNLYSSLVHLRDDNRTLAAGRAGMQRRDAGLYLCRAFNYSGGGDSLNHTILLIPKLNIDEEKVLEKIYEERTQRLGDPVQFTCSITSEQPVVWFHQYGYVEKFPHYDAEGNELTNVKVKAVQYLSGPNKVIGQTVTIDPIELENFGTYICYWKKSKVRYFILKEGGYRKELKVTVVCLITLFIIFAVLGPLCWYWRIELRLFWKDRFGKLEENDDKVYDVFVSYDAEDAPFVLGTLVPVLEDHFRYRCFAWERDSIAGDYRTMELFVQEFTINERIPETLVQSVRDSRRFLMILSPALLENRWCTFALHVALKAVLQLQLHIICIKLHDIDWAQVQLADKSANETIRQVLHVVRTVVWEPSKGQSRTLRNQQIVAVKDKSLLSFSKFIKRKNDMPDEDIKAPGRSRFWRKLRLYLPPRRTLPLLSKPPASPTSTKSLLSLPHGFKKISVNSKGEVVLGIKNTF
ncbi:Uncharacterized protein GBIM_00376, partial [Gryllus bimaculatus]